MILQSDAAEAPDLGDPASHSKAMAKPKPKAKAEPRPAPAEKTAIPRSGYSLAAPPAL